MIKANELRLGNWVAIELDGMPPEKTVCLFDLESIQKKMIGNYKPIPLTEEWLIKFGFEKRNENYYVSFFNYEMYYSSGSVDFRIGKYLLSNIKHVHSLQNLYFALTGEELTKKE